MPNAANTSMFQRYLDTEPVIKAASAVLDPDERLVHVTNTATITLPHAGEVPGSVVFITNFSATVTTLAAPGLEDKASTDADAIGDGYRCESDGVIWHVVVTAA